tara:strand:+ start:4999 stop:5727 length:729 start_codon:yes stop_codon:yes gene_type:complete
MTVILNNEKLIFIKGSKVAGSSFEFALSKFASPNDIITPLNKDEEELRRKLKFKSSQNYLYSSSELLKINKKMFLNKIIFKKKYEKFTTHDSGERLFSLLPDDLWNNYKKLGIVRNPYTFIVSAYFWANRLNKFNNIEEFIKLRPDVLDRFKNFYFIKGRDIVDIYLKFEDINNEIKKLEKLYPSLDGLSETFADFKLKEGIKPKNLDELNYLREYPNTINLINRKMEYFFNKFNYEVIDEY